MGGGGKKGIRGKYGFHMELLLFCSVFPIYKPKVPPQLLEAGEILQELKALADS